VPALTGLGSPHWDPYARGTIVGLTRGNGRAHLARAALEAIAYQTYDAVKAIEDATGERMPELRADGGATANGWLMRFQAGLLGVPVMVPDVSETTAVGAASLAALATGFWDRDTHYRVWEANRKTFLYPENWPEPDLRDWHRAVERSRAWVSRDDAEG
jgi:glycerol kinase